MFLMPSKALDAVTIKKKKLFKGSRERNARREVTDRKNEELTKKVPSGTQNHNLANAGKVTTRRYLGRKNRRETSKLLVNENYKTPETTSCLLPLMFASKSSKDEGEGGGKGKESNRTSAPRQGGHSET